VNDNNIKISPPPPTSARSFIKRCAASRALFIESLFRNTMTAGCLHSHKGGPGQNTPKCALGLLYYSCWEINKESGERGINSTGGTHLVNYCTTSSFFICLAAQIWLFQIISQSPALWPPFNLFILPRDCVKIAASLAVMWLDLLLPLFLATS